MSALCLWICCVVIPCEEPPRPVAEAASSQEAVVATAATPDSATVTDAADDSEATAAEPAEWQLQYKFTDGQQLRYRSSQESTVDAHYRGNRKTDVSHVKQQRLFTVESIDEDEVAHLVMQFEHVRMQIQSDDHPPVVFDSTMPVDEVPALFQQTAHRLKGSAARYALTAQGVPVTEPVTTATTEPESESRTKSDAATFLMPLPEKPVAVGDSWTTESVVKVRLTEDISRDVTILRTFRLQSVDAGIAVITLDSSVMSKTPSVTVRSQLIQAAPKGQVEFDIERGVMLKREIRFDESVLGALGPESILASWGNSTEELVDATAATATSAR